ncbi:MAG TPA: response regulator [Gemmatimonadaceae bacterium]|nr:response regulator [Gemmatimonadaceae bacterium]
MIRDENDVSGLLQLSRALAKGDAIVVVGPELSRLAGAPAPIDLASTLRRDLNPSTPATPLAAVAQAFRDQFGDYALYARLRAALEASAQAPTPAHRLLAELPFLVHVTTNPDALVEDTLRKLQYPIQVVADAASLSGWNETRYVQVVKLHGDLARPDTIALAERDVAHVLRRGSPVRTQLADLVRYRTVLYVGYGINDPELQLLLKMRDEDDPKPSRPAFALTFDTHHDQLAEWRRRIVRPIAIDAPPERREDALCKTLEHLTTLVQSRPTGCDILIVDDEPTLRTAFRMMLERGMPGVTVDAAENGVAAMMRMAALRPKLMLVDLIMPEMDGWRLIDAVRKEPNYAGVRFIVLTGMENLEWMQRAEKLGIPYVMKPFERDDFLNIVRLQLMRVGVR